MKISDLQGSNHEQMAKLVDNICLFLPEAGETEEYRSKSGVFDWFRLFF